MLKIGIDIDGVIADGMKMWLEEIHKVYPFFNLKEEDIKQYSLEAITGLPSDEVLGYFSKAVLNNHIEPYPGAIEAINYLGDHGNKICIISSRKRDLYTYTKKWVNDIGIKYDFLGVGINKEAFAFEYGLDIVIDDNVLEYVNCELLFLTKILFSRPWNKTYNLKDNFIIAHTWDDVLEAVEEIKRLKELNGS
jgi:uncharacterized HAD superfamily protein